MLSVSDVGVGWRQPHYSEMLSRLPDISFIEVHSENFFAKGGAALALLEQGRAHYPVSFHGVGLSLGSAIGVDSWHLDQLEKLVRRFEPVRVSDHASFARVSRSVQFADQFIHASDLFPVPFSDDALQTMCANVQRVQDRLQRQIAVENLSSYLLWRPEDGEAWYAETDFLTQLVKRTGSSLLVDLNNLYVNACNAGVRGAVDDPVDVCKSWIEKIDPSHVAEIHLAGHCHIAGDPDSDEVEEIFIDDHGSRVCTDLWHIYQFAIQRFGNVPTLIEWDTNLPSLDVLLDEACHARRIMAMQPIELVLA